MSKTTQRKQFAFHEGQCARRANQPQTDNPFHRKNSLRMVWNAGWKDEDNKLNPPEEESNDT